MTTKLADPTEDAPQVIPLDEFLNPLGENDVGEPDQSDIILHISDRIECVNHIATTTTNDDDDYISRPPPEVPSDASIFAAFDDLIL